MRGARGQDGLLPHAARSFRPAWLAPLHSPRRGALELFDLRFQGAILFAKGRHLFAELGQPRGGLILLRRAYGLGLWAPLSSLAPALSPLLHSLPDALGQLAPLILATLGAPVGSCARLWPVSLSHFLLMLLAPFLYALSDTITQFTSPVLATSRPVGFPTHL